MRTLSNEINGGKLNDIEIIMDRTGQYLMDPMAFQKYFTLAVCNALVSSFEDNHIITTFRGGIHGWGTTFGTKDLRTFCIGSRHLS